MTNIEERRCERLREKIRGASTLREIIYLGKEINRLKKQKQRQRKIQKRFI